MKISKRNKYNNDGFTIMELIVVVAGLAILSSLSIPNILGRVKLNKVEEVKALMNSWAIDCLSISRTEGIDFAQKARPNELDDIRLGTLQYQIDGDKNKCSHVAIKPLNDNEKDFFSFDFKLLADGRIRKSGTPTDNQLFRNSCQNWAGQNCGATAEQKAKWAEEDAIAEKKKSCEAKISAWLSNEESGQEEAWDREKKSCTRPVFAYKGKLVNSYEEVLKAEDAAMGAECGNWRRELRNSKFISPNGNPQTIPACNQVDWWFHSGEEFRSQIKWDEYDDEIKIALCNTNRDNAMYGGKEGEYTFTPEGPSPCGTVTYFCSKKEYKTLDAYKATSCGQEPIIPPPPPVPARCRNFKVHPFCKHMKGNAAKTNPLCVCK